MITGLGFEGYLLAVDFLVAKAAAKPAKVAKSKKK